MNKQQFQIDDNHSSTYSIKKNEFHICICSNLENSGRKQ